MHKLLYSTILLLLLGVLPNSLQAQTFEWLNHVTSANDAQVKDIALDASNNVYAIGAFEGNIDLDGNGSTDLSNGSTTADDIFVAKYDSDGNLIWSFSLDGTANFYGEGIALDGAGALYITGTYRGANIEFNPLNSGTNSIQLSTASGGTEDDIFLAKYNTSNGFAQWAFTIGDGNFSNDGYGVTTDNFGNVFLSGRFEDVVDFNPLGTAINRDGEASSDAFLAKYNGSGICQWVVTLEDPADGGNCLGNKLATDSNGDVYWTGTIDDNDPSLDINADPLGGSGVTLTTEANSADVFVAKYLGSNGHLDWAYSIGDPGTTDADEGIGVAVDAADNVYFTGHAEGPADFDPIGSTNDILNSASGTDDIFLVSYEPNGTFRWLSKIGGGGTSDEGYDLAFMNGHLYVAGRVRGTVDFYNASGIIQNTITTGSTTKFSALFAKYDLNGEHINSFVASGSESDIAYAIAANNNKVYWAGQFNSININFDPIGAPNPPVNTISDASSGSLSDYDGFLAKYDDSPPSTLAEIAITEWLSNPSGNEGTTGNRVEYVELYNFGSTAVNLRDWRILDEDTNDDVISTGNLFLPAGERLILTRNKTEFEANWFRGCPNSQVIEVAGLRLGNGTDEIILQDASGTVIWSVAYANDETEGQATHYTEVSYSNRTFGSKASPGVVRNGNDLPLTSLGYERNNATPDPNARMAASGDEGSPLNTSPRTELTRGSALELDGVDDNGQLPFILDPSATNFTAEIWFNADNIGTNPIFLHQQSGSGTGRQFFRISGGTVLRSRLGGVSTSSTTTIQNGVWYHAAITWDGTTLRLYLNGRLEASRNLTMEAATGGFTLGANRAASNRFVQGNIDELRIWNTVRSEAEIRENMHLTLGDCETGLLAYYQFNEATGTAINDVSGNSHHGTLVNGVNWAASEVNTGQDAAANSNSQTITNIPTGASTQAFVNANLAIEFKEHSDMEDITVTYQNFVPNTLNGLRTNNLPTDIQWTITDNNASVAQRLMDFNFIYPAGTFTNLSAKKYDLYWRPHRSGGDWQRLIAASEMTSNTILFKNIDRLGQFMVQLRSSEAVSDVRGSMYVFDGSDDCIEVAHHPSLNMGIGDFTLEAWFKTASTNDGQILAKGGGGTPLYQLLTNSGGTASFLIRNGSGAASIVTSISIINDGEWHHIAGVKSGSDMLLYIDGVLEGTAVEPGGTSDNPLSLVIGRFRTDVAVAPFEGAMDEVRVWNVAKSQGEVRQKMHLTLNGSEVGLVAYYQFNNDDPVGTADGVKDVTSINNGTTLNMTAANYMASEVAVAGGVSQPLVLPVAGPFTAAYDQVGVVIQFDAGVAPDGEVWAYRLETEKPSGWQSVSGDVDNEYFVIRNFGSNTTFASLVDITFDRLSYIAPVDAAQPEASSPLRLHKRNSTDFGATWGLPLASANAAAAGTNGSMRFDNSAIITSFSQFVMVNDATNSDLPVELLEFNAERKDNDEVTLTWSTASELNNKGFEVQRMYEGEESFEVVGWVDGRGTTTSTSNYRFTDENAFDGVTYYRLRQVDFDETFELTGTRVVAGLPSTQFVHTEMYPNPVSKELRLRFTQISEEKEATVRIYNLEGKIMYQQVLTPNAQEVLSINAVEGFASGTYLLSVELDGERFVQKFVKQ